jgi:uncharacterized protein
MDYKSPAIYVTEKPNLPMSVVGVATAIPAFIGPTQKAGLNNELQNQVVKITTLTEYISLFGTATAQPFSVNVASNENQEVSVAVQPTAKVSIPMYYNIQMFFNNGGNICYVVSTGTTDKDKSLDAFQKGLTALENKDDVTLIVLSDAAYLLGDSDYYALCQSALDQCNKLGDRFGIFDVPYIVDAKGTVTSVDAFRANVNNNLKYGASYTPYLSTNLSYVYSDDSVTVNVAVSSSSDAGSKEKGKANKETSTSNLTPGENIVLGTYANTNTQLYNMIKEKINKVRVTDLPSSSAVAGIYSSVDKDRGVWKAPANVAVNSIIGPSREITASQQEDLNVDATSGKSINAIRTFAGKGTLVWGARTLAGNDNEWRYIPVRRLFNYIEVSVKKASSFVVFEPNVAMTWLKVRTMIESFLDNLWRQGALAGGTEKEAYFVEVGLGTTMTSQDILEGRMIIKVGIAAVRPAEFIILEFSHKVQTS